MKFVECPGAATVVCAKNHCYFLFNWPKLSKFTPGMASYPKQEHLAVFFRLYALHFAFCY